jgi:hypothetical protein
MLCRYFENGTGFPVVVVVGVVALVVQIDW